MELVLMLTGFSAWVVAYVIIIVMGFRRKTYGMALIPICGNIIWDLTFAFVDGNILTDLPDPFVDPARVNEMMHYFCVAWATADLVMLYQIAKYKPAGQLLQKFGRTIVGVVIAVSLLVAFLLVFFSREIFATNGAHCVFWGIVPTLVISFSYVNMALNRENLPGQSLAVAWLRLVGIQLMCYVFIDVLGLPLMATFMATFLLADAAYILLLMRWRAEEASR